MHIREEQNNLGSCHIFVNELDVFVCEVYPKKIWLDLNTIQ